MKVCFAPNGSCLPLDQQPILHELLRAFADAEHRKSRLEPVLPELVRRLSDCCSSDEILSAWCKEVGGWVRWYRAPAYWLAYVLQRVTQEQGSVYHFLACSLYADAQTNFADDIALSSIETAYLGFVRNQSALSAAFDAVGAGLRDKLKSYHQYYQTWSQPFAYIDANPCADHLYTYLSRAWLIEAVDGQIPGFE